MNSCPKNIQTRFIRNLWVSYDLEGTKCLVVGPCLQFGPIKVAKIGYIGSEKSREAKVVKRIRNCLVPYEK